MAVRRSGGADDLGGCSRSKVCAWPVFANGDQAPGRGQLSPLEPDRSGGPSLLLHVQHSTRRSTRERDNRPRSISTGRSPSILIPRAARARGGGGSPRIVVGVGATLAILPNRAIERFLSRRVWTLEQDPRLSLRCYRNRFLRNEHLSIEISSDRVHAFFPVRPGFRERMAAACRSARTARPSARLRSRARSRAVSIIQPGMVGSAPASIRRFAIAYEHDPAYSASGVSPMSRSSRAFTFAPARSRWSTIARWSPATA